MDGFRDIANLNPPNQDDSLIDKIGREVELVTGGTLIGIARGITTTTNRPENLLTIAGGAAVGTGLSALQLRYPHFRVPGAVLTGGLAYFGLKDIWNRVPALGDAISDTWDSPKNERRNFDTFANNFGTPIWDAYLFWGAGKLASSATTSYLYRPGGPLVKVPELQWTERTMIPHKRTDEIARAYENTRRGIVQIQIPKANSEYSAFGTGFLVSADGKIATNAHVAMHAMERTGTTAKIFNSEGQSLTARVLKLDHVNDLALLKINEVDKLGAMRPLRLGTGDPIPHQTVYSAGHPKAQRQMSISTARYKGNNEVVNEVRKNPDPSLPYEQNSILRPSMPWNKDNLLAREGFDAHKVTRGMLSAHSHNGMSGSPVFDKSGTVFGVLHAGSVITGATFHSRVNALKALLSST